MGSAHSDVEHRMLVSRIMRIVCRPSKLALRTTHLWMPERRHSHT